MSARPPQGRAKPASLASGEPERLYTIGELADELAVTTRAIRFYEAKGLIAPARRGVARSYSRRDRARLMLILRGKNLGFSLEEIAQYLTLYDADPAQMTQTQMLLARIEAAIEDLQTKRADLDRTLRELKDIRAQCVEHLKGRAPADGRGACEAPPVSVEGVPVEQDGLHETAAAAIGTLHKYLRALVDPAGRPRTPRRAGLLGRATGCRHRRAGRRLRQRQAAHRSSDQPTPCVRWDADQVTARVSQPPSSSSMAQSRVRASRPAGRLSVALSARWVTSPSWPLARGWRPAGSAHRQTALARPGRACRRPRPDAACTRVSRMSSGSSMGSVALTRSVKAFMALRVAGVQTPLRSPP